MDNVITIKKCYSIFVTDANGKVWVHSVYDDVNEAEKEADWLNTLYTLNNEVYEVGECTYTEDPSMPPLEDATDWYEISEADQIILEGDEFITDEDYPDVPA
jgi:hypothetical protein